MIRRPTPLDQQIAWWRHAVETGSNARDDDLPRCGWFKQRERARSTTWLPVRVWLDQQIDWATGELTQPELFVMETEGRQLTDQLTVAERSLYLRPVSLDEWRWLQARRSLQNGSPATAYTYV